MRMRCLSKSSNSLITSPIFVKFHFHRFERNPHLALVTTKIETVVPIPIKTETVVPFPVRDLLNNRPITLTNDPHYLTNDGSKDLFIHQMVGSCNGLICLFSHSIGYQDICLRFWNPCTRTKSGKLGYLSLLRYSIHQRRYFKFAFGYDNITSTYKVVLLNFHIRPDNTKITKITTLEVFSLGDNDWINIQNFPAIPLQVLNIGKGVHNGVYLSGTVNWLAVSEYPFYSVDQYVIISLDLGTETYTQMCLPQGFDELSRLPTIGVLMGFLTFSYDFKKTHFVIWNMEEFGVEESWCQFLKISYENLQINYNIQQFYLAPLHLSEDGDTFILASSLEDQAILYNKRNNSVERTIITNSICWFSCKDYVESLASTC
jgi:F-box interacting protein